MTTAMLKTDSQFQSITFKSIKFDFPYFRSDRYRLPVWAQVTSVA